jgi:hypothetical protein
MKRISIRIATLAPAFVRKRIAANLPTQAMKEFPLPLILIACALRGALFLGPGLMLVQPCARASGVFEDTGSLVTARSGHTATLLPNGIVLVAGGRDSTFSTPASTELYDPASGTWTTTGSLATARDGHTATLLPNGMVLVAGGSDSAFAALASAELCVSASVVDAWSFVVVVAISLRRLWRRLNTSSLTDWKFRESCWMAPYFR